MSSPLTPPRWGSIAAKSLVCSCLAAFFAGCSKPAPPPAPPPPAVTVAVPLQQDVIEWDEFIGRLEATDTVEVRARVSGLIESQHFRDGQMVNKGDLLFVIDPRPYKAELEKAQADLASAEAEVARARGDVERAERASAGAISAEELENRRVTLKRAEALSAAAKATVESAALDVEWTEVRAAITGRASRAMVTPGNLVNGGEGAATLLTTITTLDPIYLYVDADEASVQKYIRLQQEGKRITARKQRIVAYAALSGDKTFSHQGYIDFVDNRLDPSTGTLKARAVLANPNESLVPGFFARLRVPGSEHYTALLIPESAITTDQASKSVFVMDEKNVVHRRPVETGALFGTLRAVKSGLNPSDQVVINGMLRVRDSATVTPTVQKLTPPQQPSEALPTTLPTTQPATTQASGFGM